jgi:hypothetical protein
MKEEFARRELKTVDETISANCKTANVCKDARDSMPAIQLVVCSYTIPEFVAPVELAGGGALRPAGGHEAELSFFGPRSSSKPQMSISGFHLSSISYLD